MSEPAAGGPRAEGDGSIAANSNFGIQSTGANATNTLVQLSQIPGPAVVESPPGTHNLPTPAAGMFVGRDDALTGLDHTLAAGGGVIGQAVHGLGGVGKTELALRYAHRHLSEYRLVWWVSAETSDQLTDGVAGLARRLTSVPALVDGYRWAVGWLQCHDGWLLVLDNVEDPAILRDLLGAVQGHGQVLVTTRRALATPVWGRLGLAPLRLGVLDRAASVELLVGLTGRVEEKAEAGLLAAELGDLPLALEQAGAFIAQEDWTISAYRQELAGRPGRAYAATAQGFDTQRAVDRVWALTMDRAGARAERAGWVMATLAYLAPEPLPVTVLTGGDQDPEAVEEAIRVLASYSMLTRHGGTIEVHRLVQAVTRAHDTDQAKHQQAVALLLAQAVPPEPTTNVAGWPVLALLLPHIDALDRTTPHDQRSQEMLYTLNETARYLEGQGQLDRAIDLYEQLAANYLRVLGADHLHTLIARNNLAGAYQSVGRLAEAIDLFEQVTADCLRVLGADHPSTLIARSNLAYAHQAVGRLAEAIDLYEQVTADRLRVLGTDHPGTLAARQNLAAAYRSAGRLAEAIDLFEQVTADYLRVLGADHPNMLTARNNLAGAYQSVGRLAEAIRLYEQVTADRLRVLGTDHPDTLAARQNLAAAYRSAGRLAEAIDLFEQVTADYLRVLGADHPDTLAARNSLAGAYQAVGRLAEAIDLYEQVTADYLRVLGADRPGTLAARNNLAGAYESAGRLAEAIDLYEQVTADRLRVLGAEHPDTLTARNNLAGAYESAGRLAEAIDLYEQVTADYLRVLAADHPDTLAARNNLAGAYRSAGRLAEAIDLFELVAADCLRALGAEHPNTLTAHNNLAFAYQSLGRAEAIDLFELVAADYLRVLGAEHPNTLTARNNLAGAYQSVGRLAEAIDLYEQMVADALRVLGADHPHIAIYLKNLEVAQQAVTPQQRGTAIEETGTDQDRLPKTS
ncbi:tetratricopeptide repeat protein [Micromonospora chersina]|uniref:tetratricopeptide repeat protein n=1 Tax=Micromonospora chersina TaxID=47854 RepID=UPI0033ECD61F